MAGLFDHEIHRLVQSNPYPPRAPWLVIEIRSEESDAEILSRMQDTLDSGARQFWCVDEPKREIRVWRPNVPSPSVHTIDGPPLEILSTTISPESIFA